MTDCRVSPLGAVDGDVAALERLPADAAGVAAMVKNRGSDHPVRAAGVSFAAVSVDAPASVMLAWASDHDTTTPSSQKLPAVPAAARGQHGPLESFAVAAPVARVARRVSIAPVNQRPQPTRRQLAHSR